MKPSINCINLIKTFEGFIAKPYQCPAKLWTTGFGMTFYPNGKKVTKDDKAITIEEATDMLILIVDGFANKVNTLITASVNQSQYDALVSFAYNCGCENLRKSTLLKKVNANPNDPTIALEFAKWNKGGGKVLKGLTVRRKAESDLYFS